jgi:outer membrane receptor protein involved in Fe transport
MTNEPLPGANIVVVGTSLGSATDINGQYTILQIPPRTYTVTISFVGYKKVTINDVNVDIDQTTRVDIALEPMAVEVGETIIIAERKLVKPDVATSLITATDKEIQQIPVVNVAGYVSYQAGMQPGLQIRGGRSDEALFQVNGITLRDPRNNQPISAVPLSAVQEISVERGGFNAEYGQVRSGMVNVVTKEGNTSGYHGSFTLRYHPPTQKHFDSSPLDPNSMLLRPYTDDAVCWTGTKNGAWNIYTRNQYPDFIGWNEISRILVEDKDPTNDLTPLGAQRLFMWQTRKNLEIEKPDYSVDGGFGGPVPLVSDLLGNLRFFASYRSERQMLLIPLSRDENYNWDLNLRFNSDISSNTKLHLQFLSGKEYTLANNDVQGSFIRNPEDVLSSVSGSRPSAIWGIYQSLADISYKSYSAKVTHLFSQNTILEVSLDNIQRQYNIVPPPERNYSKINEIIQGYFVDESPFGYSPILTTDITGSMDFGGHTALPRDYSKIGATTFKANLESQINFHNLMKTGIEFVYNDLDLNFGQIKRLTGGTQYANRVQMQVFPIRAAAYLQDKLEFEGFIANLGVRLDYSSSNTEWWNVDVYNKDFFAPTQNSPSTEDFAKSKTIPRYQISPRLGISHPITENSKLFFNYGHFMQLPSYQELFRIDRSSDTRNMVTYGNPNLVLSKTISYELGYDHSLFDDNLLIQVAAFYHDITDEQSTTQYTATAGFSYNESENNNYRDIRGFELTLRKSKGRYWTAFANYTYEVTTSGFFGKPQIYQDLSKQKEYNDNTVNLYQDRPIPRPYARVNLTLFTPSDIGSSFFSRKILADWTLNMLIDWRVGQWETFNPNNIQGITYNVQRTDYFNSQLRLSKNFVFKGFDVTLFIDVYNALNTRRMSLANWGSGDRDQYYKSLHLPKSPAYSNIPGNDLVGNYRKLGVAFQPIEQVNSINDLSASSIQRDAIYYEISNSKYMQFNGTTWAEVEKTRMDKILEDKAYIDMPNLTPYTFLNPRLIYFGLQVSFDLN